MLHPVSGMIAVFDPNNPWFWIVVGVGTPSTIYLGRRLGSWLFRNMTASIRAWLAAPAKAEEHAAQAAERADQAAVHAEELKDTIGARNGHGDLMSIAGQLLTQQNAMLLSQSTMMAWQRDHDVKDDATRAEVATIKAHLGLP